ncbi:MAG TPA: efflux RND transporter periplasmic adaptor subunit [Polyangiales bacterium]|nr:efflux RND transporter periplasmic adaptor subunit [Polyangiales bacterium]
MVLTLFVLLPIAGCKREVHELPPAQGEQAPAMPDLPTITKASDESTTVTTSEARTTGTTFPRAEAQLGPNAGGVIEKILVKEGDTVKRGAIVFRQDVRDAALRIEQAKVALDAARVNLRASETDYQRTKAMFEQKAMNQVQWDQAQTRFDSAKVQVQQAEVALNMANKAVADGTVRSPIDGVVVQKLKSEGEMATMMPPTVVLVIQDQSTLELRFRLPERALRYVKIGATVKAKFDALGLDREAKVTRIQSAIDAQTRTVEVVVLLPNQDNALRAGLLASVELEPAAAEAVKAAAAPAGTKPPTAGAAPAAAKPPGSGSAPIVRAGQEGKP